MLRQIPKYPVVILSGSYLNIGIVDKLRNIGHQIVIVDRNSKPDIIGDFNIQSDLLDVDYIINKLKYYNIKEIGGAYTSSDIGIKTVNVINKYFNLSNNSIEKCDLITSKSYMTDIWESNNLLNRKIWKGSNFRHNEFFNITWNSSIIVKPNKSSSSRGITILNINFNNKDLNEAIILAKGKSIDNNFIIEEFIDGQECTVEMLSDSYGNISVYGISLKYHTENTVQNKIAIKLHYNSNKISDDKVVEISNFARTCFKCLNFKSSFGHMELIIKKNGALTPIEINARSSGFIASHLVDFVSGRDYLYDYLNVLRGESVDNLIYKTNLSSMYFFYDLITSKPVINETNLMKHMNKSLKSVYHDRANLKIGNIFENLSCDNDRYGFEILIGKKNNLTIEEVIKAETFFLNELFGL